MSDLISITKAAKLGIQRIRLPIWADPLDHIKIDIIDGKPGPWMHLYCPINKEINGRDPQDVCWLIDPYKQDPNEAKFEPYTGPLPESEEYRAAAAKFEGVLAK